MEFVCPLHLMYINTNQLNCYEMFTSKLTLYKTEWLDLVFDKRNKSYGAYELRNSYSGTMTKAISITVLGFVAGALTLSIVTRHRNVPLTATEHKTLVDLSKVMQPPPENKPVKPIQHTAPLQAHPATVVIPTHVTDKEPITEPPKLSEIDKSAIGAEPSKGTGTITTPVLDPPGNGGGNGTAAIESSSNELLITAEVSPEPSGGMAGWSKFLQRNLRYPDSENQGRVVLSFVVERDGSLTDIKVLKTIGAEFDREAIRVLKMAPKWKPGLQGGQAVRVQFTIPINFQLQ